MGRTGRAVCTALVAMLLAGCETTAKIDTSGAAHDIAAGVSGIDQRIDLAKTQYAAENYGMAERNFRLAVESAPQHPVAWLGLAAAYDRLGRFDLADRAYAELYRLEGRKASILNNHGYSYVLRGDLSKARKLIGEARAQVPGNPVIEANWVLVSGA